MSILGDLWDGLTSPFKAVIDVAGDVIHGDFGKAFGDAINGAAFEVTGGPLQQAFLQATPIKNALDSKLANTLTFGASGDLEKYSDFQEQALLHGQDYTYTDFRNAYEGFGEASLKGAAGYFGGAAAGAASTAGGAGTISVGAAELGGALGGAGAADRLENAVNSGNIADIIQSGAGLSSSTGFDIGVPEGVSSAVDSATQAANDAQGAVGTIEGILGQAQQDESSAQGLLDLVKSNTPPVTSGYSSNSSSSQSSSILPIVAGAAILLLILKRK